ARRGVSLLNSTFYVAGIPTCIECAKALVQIGAIAVIGICEKKSVNEKWLESYKKSESLFKEVNIFCDMRYV
ncbi:MAG: hypothetical protein WBP82_10840, partial [Leuconostoc mesenteroides]